MNPFEVDFYYKFFEQKEMVKSVIPKSIINSAQFKQLEASGIIDSVKKGKGSIFNIVKNDSFKSFLDSNSNDIGNRKIETRADSVEKYRNSKASYTKQTPLFFIRGFKSFFVNNDEIKLNYFTEKFGAFLLNSLDFSCSKICIIENKESFLNAEVLFDESWFFIHKYGRWSTSDLINLKAEEVVVFGDYDLVGLMEYLKIKKVIPHADFYLPENFDLLFNKYSIKSNDLLGQKMSDLVKESSDPKVIKIRDMVVKSNSFLEQESLFI